MDPGEDARLDERGQLGALCRQGRDGCRHQARDRGDGAGPQA